MQYSEWFINPCISNMILMAWHHFELNESVMSWWRQMWCRGDNFILRFLHIIPPPFPEFQVLQDSEATQALWDALHCCVTHIPSVCRTLMASSCKLSGKIHLSASCRSEDPVGDPQTQRVRKLSTNSRTSTTYILTPITSLQTAFACWIN